MALAEERSAVMSDAEFVMVCPLFVPIFGALSYIRNAMHSYDLCTEESHFRVCARRSRG